MTDLALPLNREKGTRADLILRRLSDEIVNGQLVPGLRLDENELALRFQVSRTPVREALRELDAMGLVEKRPHRGVVVANVSISRLAEMFAVLTEIEVAAARLSAQNMTASERSDLEALHHASATLVRAGTGDAYEAYNREFHATLYRGSHNSFLQETGDAIKRRLRPFRRAHFQLPGRPRLSFDEHQKIVEPILRCDDIAAAEAMRQHMLTISKTATHFPRESAVSNEA